MNILIGCEESGTVREEFAILGHNAVSCDLIPSRRQGKHIQGDIFDAIHSEFWHIIILFPPCTYLAVSGNRWYAGTEAREEAVRWTAALYRCAALKASVGLAMENPIGILSKKWRKPSQVIQPWQFGHGETKATCLWLDRLPKLTPTEIVLGREQKVWKMAPGPNRQRDRSKTYEGIAKAMAMQWGGLFS